MKKEYVFTAKNGEQYCIKPIDTKIMKSAQAVYNSAMRSAMESGALLRKGLQKYLNEQNVWSDEHQKKYESSLIRIGEIEKSLNSGKDNDGNKLKITDAKNLSIELSKSRNELRSLIAEKNEQDSLTAEGQAENARFSHLVISCVYDYKTQKPVYDTSESFMDTPDQLLAVELSSEFANVYYGIEKDHQKTLTEYKFLRRFKFIDEDGNFIDKDGNRVTADGQRVDEDGRLVDENGNKYEEPVGVEEAEFDDDINTD